MSRGAHKGYKVMARRWARAGEKKKEVVRGNFRGWGRKGKFETGTVREALECIRFLG